jgi:hypothetical protein
MSVHPPAGGRLRDRHPCLASRACWGSEGCPLQLRLCPLCVGSDVHRGGDPPD